MKEEIDIMNDIMAVPPNATDTPAEETTECRDARIGRLTPAILVCIEIHRGCCAP
jgi:hypothetical protein